jgi:peptide/nickel transport system substrate-binding protein
MMEFTRVNDYEIKYTFTGPKPAIVSEFAKNNRMYLTTVPFAPGHYLSQFHIDFNSNADRLARDNGFDNWMQYFIYIYPDEIQAQMEPGVPVIDPWVLVRVDDIGNKYFDRNPFYWKIDTAGNQLPYIDGQDRLLMSPDTIRIMLPAGELDAGLQFTNIDDFQLYRENEQRGNFRTELWIDARGQVASNFKVNLNLHDSRKNEIFNNLRFREGLSLAINRNAINDVIWRGLATPRAATVSPSVSFYEDWMGNHMAQFDPQLANRKLDEAGLIWPSGQEFRTYPDGSPFELIVEFTTFEGSAAIVAEMVQQNWQAVGIRMNLRSIDQVLFNEKNSRGELEFVVWNMDNTTEFGFYGNPRNLLPRVMEWDRYMNTDGREGTRPSAEFLEYIRLINEFQSYPIGHTNYLRYGRELLSLSVTNVWNIGVAGLAPKPMVIKNGIQNTPVRGVFDYDYRFWMIFKPEQWFWE